MGAKIAYLKINVYITGMDILRLSPTNVPLPEFLIEKPVGESLAADTDTLQYTIAAQLMQHQLSVDHTGALHLVGDDATHKVRIGVAQV